MSKKLQFDSEAYYYDEPILKVFRVHPSGSRIEKAEKTLQGTANPGALTWCGPFTAANSLGWWLYPSIDIDITYYERGTPNCFVGRFGGHFRFQVRHDLDRSDFDIMSKFDPTSGIIDEHEDPSYPYLGKQHYGVDEPEEGAFSMWTGCVFQLPKDWSLMIRNPINCNHGLPATIQDGILEVDWMRYDIWANYKFHTYGKTLSLRRDQQMPIAQLIPVHKSSYMTNWGMQDKIMDANDPECQEIFERYNEYNFKKWKKTDGKDPFTFKKLKKSVDLSCPYKDLFKGD